MTNKTSIDNSNIPDQFHLLQQHLAWYPLMQVQDMYKLLYQGCMGPEHLMPTRQEFSRQLEEEFMSLPPDTKMPLIEPIRVDQALFRLNLKVYKAHHPSVEPLVSLFFETAKLAISSKPDLINSWALFFGFCKQGKFATIPIPQLKSFSGWLEREDYPPVHHSDIYRNAYLPSYRLIGAQFIPSLEASDAG